MAELFKLSDVTVQYRSFSINVKALDGVSLAIPSTGYTLGIVGESGSGKTTLGMTMLNSIEPPGKIVNGTLEYQGTNILSMNKDELRKYRWREVSMVYQAAMNSLNPVKKVSDHIMEVFKEHERLTKGESREAALKLLSEVGIPADRANAYPHELSGGMRQRVVIAMALALSPKILIADEPTSALDVVVQRQILLLLRKEILQKNLSLVFITHEISLLNGLVKNVAVMYQGEVVETGPVRKILTSPKHPYTQMLVGTLLEFDYDQNGSGPQEQPAREGAHTTIPENACKYSNRCKYAFDRCRREKPQLREVEQGVSAACHLYN